MIEAFPTGAKDEYRLVGKGTYEARAHIKVLGGRWDGRAKAWYVSREAAKRLGATILNRVHRGPACCEKNLGIAEAPVLASDADVERGSTVVTFCPHCDSRIHEVVALVVDGESGS